MADGRSDAEWVITRAEARELARAIEAQRVALDRIAAWPHVKLYAGNETAYIPKIVHKWASDALAETL